MSLTDATVTTAPLPPLQPIDGAEVRRAPARPPLHIAFALGGTDLGRSGIGTYVREVLPPLIDRVRSEGGAIGVFGRPEELAAYRSECVGALTHATAAVPATPALNALWHLTRAGSLAKRLGADVLLLPAANRRITRWSAVPTVAVVHDLAQLRVTRKYDPLRMFYFRRVLLSAFRAPAQLIAVSAATRDDLVRTLSIPADQVAVVHNGVNASRFRCISSGSPDVIAVRRARSLHGRPYLLYPARFEHPGKNHVRLLTAFARSGLALTHTLAFSGADWGAEKLVRATAAHLGLQEAVAFLGFVPAGQLPLLIAGADAVLMLGLHEGFGLPPLEALSAGRPVCVSHTGALPEVVGPLGVTCDPLDEASIAEALARVVRDPVVRDRCAREGPSWAGTFTWTRTAAGLLAACHAAIRR